MKIKKEIYLLFLLLTIFLLPKNIFAIEVADEAGLKAVLESGVKDITLTKDILLTQDVKTSSRTVGLEIKSNGLVNINGNGHKISTDLDVAIEIRSENENLNVIFTNITIEGAKRAIDTRSAGISLELNKTKLQITAKGNAQALTIGGNAERVSVTIFDSNIYGGDAGYGIITFNPVDMIIQSSTVAGYAAIYMKGADNSVGSAGSVVAITDSNIVGNNKYSGASDNFGTIVLEDANIDINVVGSKIIANNLEGSAYQVPVLQTSGTLVTEDNKNNVTILGDSQIIINTKNPDKSLIVGNLNLTLGAGVTANISIAEKFLEEGTTLTHDANGNSIVIVENPNTADAQIMPLILILLTSLLGVSYCIKKRFNFKNFRFYV
ncbi:MAG: hypothetical protein E7167_00145 [Firmicutes bacterium]|nr:hypothetical protein [Bacillota bacterium]